MKGRTIFDAVRTISDSMDYTEMKGYEGIMSVTDFEKVFDSLSLDFLFKSLEQFWFGVSFISWIKAFYKNIASNGKKIYTDKFQSKLLFETLSSQISSEPTAMTDITKCSTLRPFN